jgi:hypothetical protein
MEKTLQELETERDILGDWYKNHVYILKNVKEGIWTKDDSRYTDFIVQKEIKRQELKAVINQIIDLCG